MQLDLRVHWRATGARMEPVSAAAISQHRHYQHRHSTTLPLRFCLTFTADLASRVRAPLNTPREAFTR